jgi:hypothetical protein
MEPLVEPSYCTGCGFYSTDLVEYRATLELGNGDARYRGAYGKDQDISLWFCRLGCAPQATRPQSLVVKLKVRSLRKPSR